MLKNLSLLLLVSALFACSAEEDLPVETLPPELASLQNLTVHSLESEADTVLLAKDQTFGDTEEVFYARMNEFTVDDEGRVYVADGGWGSRSLHVYNPDGSYLMKLAGEGRGPAEFLRIGNLQYRSGNLFFYDGELQRIMLYSTTSLEPVKTVLTDPQKWQGVSDIVDKRPNEFYLTSDENILAGFQDIPNNDNSGKRKKQYFRLNKDLNINSEKLTELDARKFVHSNVVRNVGSIQTRAMKHFPFFERHFFIPALNDDFYTVDSKHFLIKKYNEQGQYMSGFYYPYQPPVVTREQALDLAGSRTEDIAENVELPDTWPAINSIHLDDENRFWISTITESEDYFKWWVLEDSGELLATFTRAGNRSNEKSSLDNHIIIKNGYFYAREEIADTGQFEVVRYKIEFEER